MNREELLEALKIRYTDLEVTLLFPESVSVPRYKVSALRGGMGQVLLGQHCVRDENCEACDFAAECLIQRTLYSQYEIQPPFARKGNSIGYVIECGDSREQIPAGGTMTFHLLLFGKTIVHAYEFLQAFYWLGKKGLGKDAARYEILNVSGGRGKSLIRNGAFCIQNLEIDRVSNYVLKREQQLLRKEGKSFIIRFLTPVTLKYRGAFIREFTKEAVLESVMRRIYSFNCFEGRKMESAGLEEETFTITKQDCRPRKEKRYSTRTGQPMYLRGSGGEIHCEEISEIALLALLAGEKTHIGKNTSFGFGKYVIEEQRESRQEENNLTCIYRKRVYN